MGASLFEKDAMDVFFSQMFFPFPPQFFAGKFTYCTSLGELQGGECWYNLVTISAWIARIH